MNKDEVYVTTHSGRKLYLLDLDPEEIVIADIAHHLALVNRFGGATPIPISVAQHSVFVSRLCDNTKDDLQALLHDASEAYLGDVPKWLKESTPFDAYRELEKQIQRMIFITFGCDPEVADRVVDADRLMVRYEAWRMLPSVLRHMHPSKQHAYSRPNEDEIKQVGYWYPWDWQTAKNAFISRFAALTEPGWIGPLTKQMERWG